MQLHSAWTRGIRRGHSTSSSVCRDRYIISPDTQDETTQTIVYSWFILVIFVVVVVVVVIIINHTSYCDEQVSPFFLCAGHWAWAAEWTDTWFVLFHVGQSWR